MVQVCMLDVYPCTTDMDIKVLHPAHMQKTRAVLGDA